MLGKTFSAAAVTKAVKQCSWAGQGKARFYDCYRNSWPIADKIVDPVTNAEVLVPMEEGALLEDHLNREPVPCIFFKAYEFNQIVQSVDQGIQSTLDYKTVIIKSTMPGHSYNFYEHVTDGSWFGFRVLEQCNFAPYCYYNLLHMGANTQTAPDLEIYTDIEHENQAAGFGNIVDLYSLENIHAYFAQAPYTHPSHEALMCFPPGFNKIPFRMTEMYESDEPPVDPHMPPWTKIYFGADGFGEGKKAVFARPDLGDDAQSSEAGGPSLSPESPGSTPLKDRSNGQKGTPRSLFAESPDGPSSEERPLKRRRASVNRSRFISMYADASDDGEEEDEGEEVSLPTTGPLEPE